MHANIVFDLDGTLIDSAPDIQGIANALLADRNRDPIDLKTTRSFIGRGARVFLERLSAARGLAAAELPDLLDAFMARYDTAVDLTEIFPGVEAILTRLAATHALGICTNKPYRPCLAVLKHLELDRFFTAVLGGDSLTVRKPHPQHLLSTFAEMGLGPRIYVGDSETDAETAQRAEIPFILFTQGYRTSQIKEIPHTALFDDFAQFPEVLEHVLGTSARG